jgi:hypothetical protein
MVIHILSGGTVRATYLCAFQLMWKFPVIVKIKIVLMATIIWRNKLYTVFSLEMSIYWKLLGLYLSTKDINPVL